MLLLTHLSAYSSSYFLRKRVYRQLVMCSEISWRKMIQYCRQQMAHVKKAKHTLISCTLGSLKTVFKFVSTAVFVGLWGRGGVRRGLVYEHFDVL